MNINLYKKYFLILLPMLYSCSQDTYVSKYDHLKKIKNPAYETCLNDANYNIENLQNFLEFNILSSYVYLFKLNIFLRLSPFTNKVGP